MDIQGTVDLALITTPARTIPDILKRCGKKNVAGAVIIAGGFRELGDKGKELEQAVVNAAQENGIRFIGPNTSGMINLKTNMNLVGIQNAPLGNIALLCQSGNMALTLITEATIRKHEGFTYYVGVGNESDIKFHEYLEFFRNDPDTKVILMYVEGMSEGRKFLQEAYKTSIKKPIVLLKSGRSATGKRSAGSHTGSLAGVSEVAKAAYGRAGIVVIENSDELFPVAETLSSQPPIKNNTIAILADGGGHATIAADLLSDYGINMPQLSDKTQDKLRAILPEAASLVNPVDVAGGTDADPSLFADCVKIIIQDPNIGGILVVGFFGGYGIRFEQSLAIGEVAAAHRFGAMVKKEGDSIIENAKAYNPKADIRGVLVAPMAQKGLEIIIGAKTDELFGPVIMYGLGGIMVEIMKDVTFWVLPVSPSSCRKMIEETRSSIILDGVRGQKGYDKKSLTHLFEKK